MKIAFIGQKGIPSKFGGVEKHVEDLSRRLAAAGHEVFVYTRPNYTEAKLTEWQGVKLISLPSVGTKHLDAISHTFRACLDVAKRNVDIIHFHSIGPASLIWLMKLLKSRIPVVATFHTQCYMHQKWGSIARWYLKFGEWICCNFADRTIAVSRTLAKYATDKYRKPIIYIPNGVEIRQITGAENIKTWGLEPDNYLVAVSRLVRHKGLQYLIKAFKEIKTDKKLVIVGDGAFTDKYVAELKELANSDARIIFTGNQSGSALNELFANAYLFVQPSESEGLSIALLEAMSYGRGVLVSDIPENLEAVGDTGFTFNNKNVINLREKLVELLQRPERVAENGRLNVERVRTHYNWDNIVAEIQKVYDKLKK